MRACSLAVLDSTHQQSIPQFVFHLHPLRCSSLPIMHHVHRGSLKKRGRGANLRVGMGERLTRKENKQKRERTGGVKSKRISKHWQRRGGEEGKAECERKRETERETKSKREKKKRGKEGRKTKGAKSLWKAHGAAAASAGMEKGKGKRKGGERGKKEKQKEQEKHAEGNDWRLRSPRSVCF